MIGEEVKVDRTDLLFFQRAVETALAELEAAVADGDVKESVALDLEETLNSISGYLR